MYMRVLTKIEAHTPGSVSLQGLSRFGSLVNDLAPVGVFGLGLLRRHLRPQRLLGLLVAMATSGAALRRNRNGGRG